MASRASLLSGYRPDKGQIFQNNALFTHVPDALTLNQLFMNNGYETVAMGKIYHHESDYEQGWNRPHFIPKGEWKGRGYLSKDSQALIITNDDNSSAAKRTGMGPAFESPDVPDNAYADGLIAEHAIQEFNRLKDKPFFMAVGFARPHLPFNAPKKYWDLYPENEIKLSDNPLVPDGAPKEALTDWSELRGYVGMPAKGPMPDDLARQLIHGYYASVSYTDAMIGKVLDELDRLGLADNTVIVLWGDHGWKLGDYGMWCKHTPFEIDIHVPMMGSKPKFVWGKVSHLLNPGDAEDDIQAIIEGENGIVADIDMTCVDASRRPSWIINGRWGTFWIAEGKAHIKYISPKRMKKIHPIDLHLALNRKYGVQPGPDTMPWKEETMDVKPTGTYESFYDNLYKAIRKGKPLLVTPESARETYDVLSRIKRGSGFQASSCKGRFKKC